MLFVEAYFAPLVEQVQLFFDIGHSLGFFFIFSLLLLDDGREILDVEHFDVPSFRILVRIGADVAVGVDFDCPNVGQCDDYRPCVIVVLFALRSFQFEFLLLINRLTDMNPNEVFDGEGLKR